MMTKRPRSRPGGGATALAAPEEGTTSEADPPSGGTRTEAPRRTRGTKTEPAGDGAEQRVFQSIRRVIRAVDLHSHKLAHQFGVTVPQLTCLLKIIEAGEMTCGELARAVSLSPSTVVGILDRLTAKGFILGERSREDRRLVMVRATAEGTAFARSCPSPLHDRLALAMAGLTDRERSGLAEALERIVELMEIGGVDAAPILDSGARLDAPAASEQKSTRRGRSGRG